MSTKQLQASSLQSLAQTLATLGQMLLLMLVWTIFFLWALLAIESLLIPWLLSLTSEQGFLNAFFGSGIGGYLLAFAVVMVSLTLFFYRMPRAQEKVNVPLEFALTTMLFIAFHLFVIGYAMPWLQRCSPVSTGFTFEQFFSLDLSPAQTCTPPAVGLVFTVLALGGLFCLQGSERLWQQIRGGNDDIE